MHESLTCEPSGRIVAVPGSALFLMCEEKNLEDLSYPNGRNQNLAAQPETTIFLHKLGSVSFTFIPFCLEH